MPLQGIEEEGMFVIAVDHKVNGSQRDYESRTLKEQGEKDPPLSMFMDRIGMQKKVYDDIAL